MLAEIPPEELSDALDAAAAEVLTQAGVEQPPVDSLCVARALGTTVAVDERQQGRARYVRLQARRGASPRTTILLRPEPRLERRQWAVAHEIGEHVAHRVFSHLLVDSREIAPGTREKVANHLAGRLLLPTAWFGPDAESCQWDLIELKRRYRTASHELIARRMLDFPPPVIITIFDQGGLYLRRSNVPGEIPAPSSAEMECYRTTHDRNRPYEASEGTQLVRSWPVHEEGWKREILRTEVDVALVS